MTAPKFSISILAHGGIEHTRRCLKSVIDGSREESWELILTDNASEDGTLEFFEVIQEAFPGRVRIVANKGNDGFIDPNRKALEMARGEFFVLLNNDAEVPEGWLSKLVQPYDKWESCALVGSQGGCTQLNAELVGEPGTRLEYIEGSCMLGKTEFLKKIGLFSDYLQFAYFEDCDLSLRVRELGYTIHQADFAIRHHRATTSKRVVGIEAVKAANHEVMKKRWAHYAKVRTMDYPIHIKRAGATGDVLLITPIVRALAQQRPNCPISIETSIPSIFRGNPYIAKASKSLIPNSRALVIDLNMAYEKRPHRHYVDGYAQEAGISHYTLKTDLFVNRMERQHAEKRLGLGRCCAIHPGPTAWPGRDWKESRWQEVIDHLHASGWKTVLVGAKHYSLVADMDLRGKTNTIHELAAILAACRLFVGIDSFPMHCAQAVGTPIVPLFGCSLPQFVLTHGSRAFPVVGHSTCVGQRHREIGKTFVSCSGECMDSITSDAVISAIEMASQSVLSQPAPVAA